MVNKAMANIDKGFWCLKKVCEEEPTMKIVLKSFYINFKQEIKRANNKGNDSKN